MGKVWNTDIWADIWNWDIWADAEEPAVSQYYPGYLVDNLLCDLDFDTDVTSSSEDTSYPLENICNRNPASKFKWESESSSYIEFDLGSSIDIDVCAIMNHSFDSGDTVVIKAGNSPTPTTTIMTLVYRSPDMYSYLSSPVSARYIRLEWTGAEAAHSIGEMVIGELVTLDSLFDKGVLETDIENKISRETLRGVHSVYDMYETKEKIYSFRNLTATEKAAFKLMHTSAYGSRYPILWIPNTGQRMLLYGYKQDDFEMANSGINKFNYNLRMISASRGE